MGWRGSTSAHACPRAHASRALWNRAASDFVRESVSMQLRVVGAALAVLCAAGCATHSQESQTRDESPVVSQDGFLPTSTHRHQCRYGGHRLGTGAWADQAPAVVGVPSSDLASNGSVKSAWVCGGADTVLTYPHLTVTFEPGWSNDDQTSNWIALVKAWRTGSVETVHGYPAYVAGVSGVTPRGELLFVVDGTLVRIIGNGKLSAADLVTVGNSLKE